MKKHCLLKATLRVATTLVAMAPKILELATWFVKKISLNQRHWLPNGNQAKTLTWRVEKKEFLEDSTIFSTEDRAVIKISSCQLMIQAK